MVVDQHDGADLQEVADFTSGEDGNADATVAGGFVRHVAAAVNRHAAADEVCVVGRSQRTCFPADVFGVNEKSATRRVSDALLAFVHESRVVARRYWKH